MKMVRFLALSSLALTLIGSSASAQQQNFYGANGQFQGSAHSYGNQTNYYGSNGQYMGQSQTYGNQTNYYGANGQYQGQRQRY
jgi:hypothetical protein